MGSITKQIEKRTNKSKNLLHGKKEKKREDEEQEEHKGGKKNRKKIKSNFIFKTHQNPNGG
jgi:hypothetical protein